jgi:isopenicillin N synthase-like dioxygenase
MFHASLFEQEGAGFNQIKSFTRYASIWPKGHEEFKETLSLVRDYFFDLSKQVLSCVEDYYDMPKGDLSEMIEDGWSVQRAMLYHPYKDESRVGSLSVGEHRDTSLLTITFGGSQSGLELKDEYGNWVPVCGKEADVIIGVGGMLEHIVNGNFKNMFHRVKYTQDTLDQARISTPFFCWPKPESVLATHPSVLKKHNQRSRFSTQLALEHLEQNLMVPFSYAEDKNEIENYFKEKKKAS